MSIFGADDDTGHDGPYSRLLKCRKWIYLSALGISVVSHNLYDPEGLTRIIPFLTIPSSAIYYSSVVGGFYMLARYAVLGRQLCSTHDLVLKERLRYRRQSELDRADESLREAIGVRDDAIAQRRRDIQFESNHLTSRIEELEGILKEMQTSRPSSPKTVEEAQLERHHQRGVELAAKQIDDCRRRLENIEDEPEILAKVRAVQHFEKAKALIGNEDPSKRPGYIWNEYVLDIMSLALPVITFGFFFIQSYFL